MNIVTIYVILVFVTVHCTQSLRCRSGNQKLSDEYQKIMQTCRRRYSGSRGTDDNSSTDDSNDSEDDSSSSDGSVFGRDFFSGSKKTDNNNNDQYNNTRRMENQSYRNYRSRQFKRNSDIRNYHGNSMNNSTQTRNMRNRDSKYGMQHENNSRNFNNEDQQFCKSQCFFDEMNVVDRRGYPERVSVTRVMSQGVQDPAVRDFIEESILECFHFIMSTMNVDKCAFSQHLLNCLTDKGREGCEDWSN